MAAQAPESAGAARRLGAVVAGRHGRGHAPLKHPLRHGPHGQALVHRRLLDPPERVRLRHPLFGLQLALSPVEELAHLEPLLERADLAGQRRDLLEAADRDLDGWHQVSLGERLHQVGHGSRVTGPLDQLTLVERGQDDHRRDLIGGHLLSGRYPVQDRHLHVEDDQVRPETKGEIDGLLAIGGLTDHRIALFLEHLLEVEPDQRLVFGDQNAQWGLTHAHDRTCTR